MSQQSLFDDGAPKPPAPDASEEKRGDRPVPEASPRPYTPEERLELMTPVRDEALTCSRCELSQSRTNVVFGEGNINTPLVLVGEGPGETEDATGRPFVGRAGKLLDAALAENGMTRQHVYICNVVKCRASLL